MNIDTQQLCNSNSSSPHDEATTTMSNAMAPRTPKSIFRQPTIGSTEADTISGLDSSSTPSSSSSSATSIGIPIPAHWPIARSPLTTHFTPRFADDPITSTHYRPRTPPEDVPFLFYSAMDVKRFKGEYRQLLIKKGLLMRRDRKLARTSSAAPTTRQQEENSHSHLKKQAIKNTTRRQIHPHHVQWQNECSHNGTINVVGINSYRERSSYYDPLNDGSVVSEDENDRNEIAQDQHTSSLDIISSPLTFGGLRGNVLFDMAREAVSAWNGGHISGSGGQHRRRRPSITTVQLVDTMYLY